MEELGLTIRQLVEQQLPAGFSVSEDYLVTQLRIWQLLMYRNAKVPEEDKYTIDKYSEEWQILLAYLITWNIYQRILAQSFITSVGITSGETSSKGAIKKITTGPTDVEFHNTTTGLANIIKSLNGPEGLMAQLMGMACPIASVLQVKLPFCQGNSVHTCFKIAYPKTNCCNTSAVNNIICNELSKPRSMG